MNEPSETVMGEEQVVWRGHSSHLVNFGVFVLCGLFCWLIVPIIIAFWKYLQNRYRIYEVTTQRIKMITGVFSRATEEVELYRVRDYRLEEPFWTRLFGLGNIVVSTTDNTNQVVVIEAIPNANELRDQIRTHVEICREKKHVRIMEVEE